MPEILYDKLCERLDKMILEGAFKEKLPGIHKLAKFLGANHITVRKAIDLLIEQGVLEVIPRRGTFLRKKENSPRNFHVIGCIGISCSSGIRDLVIDRENARLLDRGYRVLDISASAAIFQKNPRLLLQFPVDGYIFFGSAVSRTIMRLLLDNHIPLICSVNDRFPEIDHVGMDHIAAYTDALRTLKKRGCRRIAFHDYTRHDDFQNYLGSIRELFRKELGHAFDPDLFSICNPEDYFPRYGEDFAQAAAEDFVRSWGSSPPDGLITVHSAVPAMKRLAPGLVTLAFSTFGTPCESDIVMYHDLPTVLRTATDRMLELLSGDTTPVEIKLPFIRKEISGRKKAPLKDESSCSSQSVPGRFS